VIELVSRGSTGKREGRSQGRRRSGGTSHGVSFVRHAKMVTA
jgi:hypothetical protein